MPYIYLPGVISCSGLHAYVVYEEVNICRQNGVSDDCLLTLVPLYFAVLV